MARAAARLGAESTLLDGEIVVLGSGGLSDFQALQRAGGDEPTLFYYVFDLLYLDGFDLRRVPLLRRKRMLRELVVERPSGEPIRYSSHLRGHGPDLYREACGQGAEGIVSKKSDAPYVSGRGHGWIKTKCLRRQEFVVVGFTEPSGSRPGFGALLLAVHDRTGELTYAGKVGTGFSHDELGALRKRLEELEADSPPVAEPPTGAGSRDVRWVGPELVAEVSFTEWTDDGRLRQPSFRGLREDRDPENVVRERPDGRAPAENGSTEAGRGEVAETGAGDVVVAGVGLSSPGRVLWEERGVTKRDLAVYWAQVGARALEHMAERPLTLLRCPAGTGEECFYQKRPGAGMPDALPRVEVEPGNSATSRLSVSRIEHLIALVQLGTLEFHVSNARRDRLGRPDRIVFDLDPGRGVEWNGLQRAALLLRDALDHLGLRSFVRVTGGKGLHVLVPLVRRAEWEEVKRFARAVAETLERAAPDRFVAEMSREKREGRVFVDYLRNDRHATSVASYSPRAREGAPVAVPLSWEEVESSEQLPRRTVEELLGEGRAGPEPDPWSDVSAVRQSITREMRASLELE